MREILFRGKRTDNGEWVDGNLFIPDIPETPTQICVGTNIIRICYEIDPNTIGQYIGECDKNGKKIFEGDILQKYSNSINERCVIGYEGSSFIYSTPLELRLDVGDPIDDHINGIDVSIREVIGNIHDNPELIRR